MSKFREHLKWAAEIVASWPPWKRNLLENSMKATCPAREPVSPREDFQSVPRHDRNPLECSLRPRCPMMNSMPSPTPQVKHKYLFQLYNKDHRRAIVVDWSIEDAKLRCRIDDPQGGWDDAAYRIVVGVRSTMTNLVLCMEMKR